MSAVEMIDIRCDECYTVLELYAPDAKSARVAAAKKGWTRGTKYTEDDYCPKCTATRAKPAPDAEPNTEQRFIDQRNLTNEQ